jgi:hypothetical protein
VPPWDWRKSEKENAPGWRTTQFEGKSAVLILGENQLSNVSAEYRFFRGRMSRMPEFTHIEESISNRGLGRAEELST